MLGYAEASARLIGLRQLLDEDLDAVCADLAAEFGEHVRRPAAGDRRRRVPRLLPRAGGAALERHARSRRQDRSRGLRQLRPRRAGLARGAARPPGPAARAPRHDPAAAAGHRPFRLHRPRGRHRLADLLPRPAAEVHRRQHQRPAQPAGLRRGRARRGPAAQGLPLLFLAARSTATRPRTRSRRPRPTGATSPAPARGPATTNRSASARRCASSTRKHEGIPVRMARPFNNYGPGSRSPTDA